MKAADHQIQSIANAVSEFTCPIFLRGDTGHPRHLGSSVHLRLGASSFLLTAAHVADEALTQKAWVGLGEELAPLGGTAVSTNRPSSGNREEDSIDIAVIELTQPPGLDLRDFPAVTPERLDISDGEDLDDLFFVVGFPFTKQGDRIRRSELDVYAYSALVDARPPAVDPKVGRVIHLDLNLDRRRMFRQGVQVTAPGLRGMSGCGVWRVRDWRQSHRSSTLAGILTEYDKGRKRLRATRTWLLLGAIWNGYPALRPLIPLPTSP